MERAYYRVFAEMEGKEMNIAITGKFGSGKTTIANYLAEKHGYTKMSLADPMRRITKEIFGIESKKDPRYRRIMQKLGTDWFRSEDPEVWIKYLLKRVERERKPVVVDDVRFPNEALALSCRGWKLIYLMCPFEERRRRCIQRDGHFDESTLTHPSETGVDEVLKLVRRGVFCETSWIEIDASQDIEAVQQAIEKALFG